MQTSEIYLDNAATAPLLPEVIQDFVENASLLYANPSSLHQKGLDAECVITDTRQFLASLLNISRQRLFFTSGASESNNWAMENTWRLRSRRGGKIIVSPLSHNCILEKAKSLERLGANIIWLPIGEDGLVDIEKLAPQLDKSVIFYSHLIVNNETGIFDDPKEIINLIRSNSPHCLLHLDGVQLLGKYPDLSIVKKFDYASFSSHKIGGPKGVGVLYAGSDFELQPMIFGGGQEFGMRGGTENVLGIRGFYIALKQIQKNVTKNYEKMKLLQNDFESKILKKVDDSYINKGSSDNMRSPYISNISFEGVRGEVLVHALAEKKVYISTGAACSSTKDIYSHVLAGMGVSRERLKGAVRFSSNLNTTVKQMEDVVDIVKDQVEVLRHMEGFKR